jgi:hypothetical protein
MDDAVFQCGSKILRGKIIMKEEGTLKDLLRPDNYEKIIPIANNFGARKKIVSLNAPFSYREKL